MTYSFCVHIRRLVLFAGVIVGAVTMVGAVHGRAAAYNDDGHFYTAVSIAHSRLPALQGKSRDAAVLIALCAQVPDLAKEFDAVSLRVRLAGSLQGTLWGGFSSCRGGDVSHMVTVHHYLHGLTDGNSDAVTEAAGKILQDLLPAGEGPEQLDPNRVCAAGFAVHLLGDSFAHRRIKDPKRMYPPGRGHLSDDHNPDFILYNTERSQSYLKYAQELDKALKSLPADARWKALSGVLQQLSQGAELGNRYSEDALRNAFRETLRTSTGDDTPVWAPYKPTVEELSKTGGLVLTRTCKEVLDTHAPAAAKTSLSCNAVWARYKEAAIPAFKNAKIAQTCPADDAWTDGLSPRGSK